MALRAPKILKIRFPSTVNTNCIKKSLPFEPFPLLIFTSAQISIYNPLKGDVFIQRIRIFFIRIQKQAKSEYCVLSGYDESTGEYWTAISTFLTMVKINAIINKPNKWFHQNSTRLLIGFMQRERSRFMHLLINEHPTILLGQ